MLGKTRMHDLRVAHEDRLHSRDADAAAHGSAGSNALSSPAGLGLLNGQVSQQATMIAYNNDFKLMLILSLVAIPLVFVFRKARPTGAVQVAAE